MLGPLRLPTLAGSWSSTCAFEFKYLAISVPKVSSSVGIHSDTRKTESLFLNNCFKYFFSLSIANPPKVVLEVVLCCVPQRKRTVTPSHSLPLPAGFPERVIIRLRSSCSVTTMQISDLVHWCWAPPQTRSRICLADKFEHVEHIFTLQRFKQFVAICHAFEEVHQT